MSATIRDVARRAGVSVATVSRVVNDSGTVREATASRVQEAIEDLGYVPHGGARSLTTRETGIIGVVLPEMHGDFFSELIRGIDRVARKAGYHVLISGSHSDRAETAQVLTALHGRVDGLILMVPLLPGDGGEPDLRLPSATPVVLLNGYLADGAHDSINLDNRAGARLAVDHLLDLGHRRIALVAGPEGNADAVERRRGYYDALAARGVEADPELELAGDFREESGFEAGARLAGLDPRPTAAFAANDAMAFGCLAALRARGLEVPGDVSLVGFDDVPLARFHEPALTTVRVPIAEVGGRAMERLLEVLRDGRHHPWHHEIRPTLAVRGSTAARDAAAAATSSPPPASTIHPPNPQGGN